MIRYDHTDTTFFRYDTFESLRCCSIQYGTTRYDSVCSPPPPRLRLRAPSSTTYVFNPKPLRTTLHSIIMGRTTSTTLDPRHEARVMQSWVHTLLAGRLDQRRLRRVCARHVAAHIGRQIPSDHTYQGSPPFSLSVFVFL